MLMDGDSSFRSGPKVIKLFMLNSTEHEINYAHRSKNANNCWHFRIYYRDKYTI